MFERGISPKRALQIGLSFDNLQRGTILKIKKSFSTTKWGEINNHTDAYNKFWAGRFIVVKNTPTFDDEGRVSFRYREAYNYDAAVRGQQAILAKPEDNYYGTRVKIEDMSRLQFNRRFDVVK